MEQDSEQVLEQFESRKIKVIERTYIYFFIVNILSLIISRSSTAYAEYQEAKVLLAIIRLLTVLLGIILLTKFYVTKIKLKKNIYLELF